jgi:glycosyltransferase involved in cell wall biosynthesis
MTTVREERRLPGGQTPFFSVCIPQFNRTSFLLSVLRSLDAQDTRDFEVCVSDDCSTDGRWPEVLDCLRQSSMAFVFHRAERNLRYDGNLRQAMALAAGRYLFLLGNDDVLKDGRVLSTLRAEMDRAGDVAVVFTNFEEFSTGTPTRRVRRTGIIGSGPDIAAASFRKFSFVSGVVLAAAPTHALSTTKWDGSEMYQMYVGTRMIADGGRVLDVDLVAVRKDVRLSGEQVDSYARRPRVVLRAIPEQRLPFDRMGRLVFDALAPAPQRVATRVACRVVVQYLGFQYLYWLLEYRRVQSWRFAAGVGRAMRPGQSLDGVRATRVARMFATCVYVGATLVGLSLPLATFGRIRTPVTRLARRISDLGATTSRS